MLSCAFLNPWKSNFNAVGRERVLIFWKRFRAIGAISKCRPAEKKSNEILGRAKFSRPNSRINFRFEMLGNPRLIELSSGLRSYGEQSLRNCHSFAPLTRCRRQFFMHMSTMVYMRSAHLTLFIKIAAKIPKWECQVRCHDSGNSPSAACCHGFALARWSRKSS